MANAPPFGGLIIPLKQAGFDFLTFQRKKSFNYVCDFLLSFKHLHSQAMKLQYRIYFGMLFLGSLFHAYSVYFDSLKDIFEDQYLIPHSLDFFQPFSFKKCKIDLLNLFALF